MSPLPLVGFFGKLPSHGDFVHANLPPSLVEALDTRVANRLAGAERQLGSRFEAKWRAASAWRFAYQHGALDPADAVSGVWTPSVDRVGRCFPLIIAVVHPAATGVRSGLDQLEVIAHETIAQAAPHGLLLQRINSCARCLVPCPDTAPSDVWWRAAGGQPGPDLFVEGALDKDEAFAQLLEPSIALER